MAKSTAILGPNYGLYLGRPSITIPEKGLDDCLNVRIRDGKISAYNLGWTKFKNQTLSGPVTLQVEFVRTNATRILIVGTPLDLYQYNGTKFVFIDPRYETGTAARTGTAVTGTGTLWTTNGIKTGDYIHFGAAAQTDPDVTWHRIASVTSETALTTDTSGVVADGAYTIRKTFTGDAVGKTDYWSALTFPRADIGGGSFADRWYATNGRDKIAEWDGTATQVTLRSEVTTTKQLARWKNIMLYLAPTTSGTFKPFTVLTSDVGKPTTIAGGLAAEFIATPSTARIQTVEPLGDDMVIYTERELVTMTFVGSPLIWSFRVASPRTGVMGPRLVANLNDVHYYLSDDGLHVFNGVRSDLIDTHVWSALTLQRDHGRKDTGFVTVDEENGEIMWAVPLTTDGTTAPKFAWVQHYLEPVPEDVPTPYTKRQFPFMCSGSFLRETALTFDQVVGDWTAQQFAWNDSFFAAAFPQLLVGTPGGVVMVLNSADAQDTVPYTSFATFPRRAAGDLRERNLVKRLYVFAEPHAGATWNLTVTLTVYDHQNETPGRSTVSTFNLTLTGEQFVAPYRRGRYFQVQFGTAGAATGQPWRVTGYDVDLVSGGRR